MKYVVGVVLGLLAGVTVNAELGLLSMATSGGSIREDSSPLLTLAALCLLLLEAAACCWLLIRRAPDATTVARRGCVLGIILSVAMFPLLAYSKSAVEQAGRQKTDLVELFTAKREEAAFASMESALTILSSVSLVLYVAALAVMYLSRRDHPSASRTQADGAGARPA